MLNPSKVCQTYRGGDSSVLSLALKARVPPLKEPLPLFLGGSDSAASASSTAFLPSFFLAPCAPHWQQLPHSVNWHFEAAGPFLQVLQRGFLSLGFGPCAKRHFSPLLHLPRRNCWHCTALCWSCCAGSDTFALAACICKRRVVLEAWVCKSWRVASRSISVVPKLLYWICGEIAA